VQTILLLTNFSIELQLIKFVAFFRPFLSINPPYQDINTKKVRGMVISNTTVLRLVERLFVTLLSC
jgi:hypothetical protein